MHNLLHVFRILNGASLTFSLYDLYLKSKSKWAAAHMQQRYFETLCDHISKHAARREFSFYEDILWVLNQPPFSPKYVLCMDIVGTSLIS